LSELAHFAIANTPPTMTLSQGSQMTKDQPSREHVPPLPIRMPEHEAAGLALYAETVQAFMATRGIRPTARVAGPQNSSRRPSAAAAWVV
jgi:hypothetical protein